MMQTLLSGAAQVTNKRVLSGESTKPDGDSGITIEAETFRLAVSKYKTRFAVAQAT
jgi:hypothetical protein